MDQNGDHVEVVDYPPTLDLYEPLFLGKDLEKETSLA
jgi:hypothetical protein